VNELIEIYRIIDRIRSRAEKAASAGKDATVHRSAVAATLEEIANTLTKEVDGLVASTARSRVALQQIMNVKTKGAHTNSFECRKAVIEAKAIMNGERKIS